MRSIRPSHKFGYLWIFLGVTKKILEVPKSPWIQGFWSDGPGEASSTIYWPETLFSAAPLIAANLFPPWLPSLRERDSLQNQEGPRKKEDKGAVHPLGRPPPGRLRCRRCAVSLAGPPPLPLGEAHVHHHLQHLLIISTVISWQTWCVVQSIIFLWSIVFMSKFE
jgi:hypothetical protein